MIYGVATDTGMLSTPAQVLDFDPTVLTRYFPTPDLYLRP